MRYVQFPLEVANLRAKKKHLLATKPKAFKGFVSFPEVATKTKNKKSMLLAERGGLLRCFWVDPA